MILKINFLIVFSLLSIISFGSTDDSIGVVLKNNKVFILHKVESGDGLYALAKRYKVKWTAIKDENPGSEKQISIDQTLLIPTGKTEAQFFGTQTPHYFSSKGTYVKPSTNKSTTKPKSTETVIVDNSSKTSFTILYTVKKGETLYSIAQKFSTTADFLKQLNKLEYESLEIGSQILVPSSYKPEDSVSVISVIEEKKVIPDDKNIPVDSIQKSSKPEISDKNTKGEDQKHTSTTSVYTMVIEKSQEFGTERIIETGIGKVLNDKKIDQSQYLVSHHSAPENTTITITNPINNKTVYAKVVRNFSRDAYDPLIIYLTKKTIEDLGLGKKDTFNLKISFAK